MNQKIKFYFDKLTDLHNKLSTEKGRYKISSSFPPQDKRYGIPLNIQYFRFWPAAEESKHRITEFGNNLCNDPLMIYTDFLYDYAPIICHHLGKTNIDEYNNHALIQVGDCGLYCWHCYLDWKEVFNEKNLITCSAKNVFDYFLSEHLNSKNTGKRDPNNSINVLRITGGEPFLLPELIIEVLQYFKDQKEKDIFVWTETNLTPFLKGDKDLWIDTVCENAFDRLKEVRDYFCIHPCVHGISNSLFLENCEGAVDGLYNFTMEGLRDLVGSTLNIYPTIGVDVNSVELISDFFYDLIDIHKNLPQKFALIDYKFHYNCIRERMKREIDKYSKIYNRILVIEKWDSLLKEEYGEDYGYGKLPRYNVKLD